MALPLFFSVVFCYAQHNPAVLQGVAVSASSELSSSDPQYSAENLIDHTWRSWAEGVPGNGIGQSFTLTCRRQDYYYRFDTDNYYGDPADDKSRFESIAGFALKNGYGNFDYYSKNGRVKAFAILIDDVYTETIAVKDSMSFEQYTFKAPVSCKSIRFVIDDVYPGTINTDTCVSEIVLLTRMHSDQDFYENILFWIMNAYRDGVSMFESNDKELASVPDPDRIMLWDYLPFDTTWIHQKTKIALLSGQSSLKLESDLPRLDGATAMYPLYSSFVRAVYPETKFSDESGYDDFLSWPYLPNKEVLMYRYGSRIPDDKFNSIVQCNKTSAAYQRLIDGETDIVFCYKPSQAEIRAAAKRERVLN